MTKGIAIIKSTANKSSCNIFGNSKTYTGEYNEGHKYPCYKYQDFPLHVQILSCQRSVAGKEAVVCHNCIFIELA